MKFGLEERHWRLVEKELIEPLKARGARVWLFGSRAVGTAKKYSDIDILYAPSAELAASFVGGLLEALEESGLPYKLDLVKESDLAESYRDNVLRQRIVL